MANIDNIGNEVVNKIHKVIEFAMRRWLEDIYSDYSIYYTGTLQRIFNEAMKAFYRDYIPIRYKRRESLYNILVLDIVKEMGAVSGIDIDFDNDAIAYRPNKDGGGRYSGEDGLYDLVFKKGWHGGADHAAEGKQPPHPAPGVPYWRAGNHFERWGRRAKKAKESPFNAFIRKYKDYVDQDMQDDFDSIMDYMEPSLIDYVAQAMQSGVW